MGEALTEDMVYDAADVIKEETPLEKIKFLGISVQTFSDISILLKMESLTIIQFRLCNFNEFPEELFFMPNLESIDLSGNAISKLPTRLINKFDIQKSEESENSESNDKNQAQNEPQDIWLRFKKLTSLNLSENNLADINEIFKMKNLPNLRQLTLTGNICLSSNNSFNRITESFPKLEILNESIITSQHRGFINQVAAFDSESLIPISKLDDLIFLYVKYLRVTANERFVRRMHMQFFCLNRILRKYSSALIIQSRFRGYIVRKSWKSFKRNSLFIKNYLKFWYHRRSNAALTIQSAYRHYKMKQTILQTVSARKIQSAFRKYMTRTEALISLFEDKTAQIKTYKIYLSNDSLMNLYDFLDEQNIEFKSSIQNNTMSIEDDDDYKIIRQGPLKQRKLPGSPSIYYNVDESVLIRKNQHNQPNSNSIWCNHDHKHQIESKQASSAGINYTKPCIFSNIKYRPYTKKIEFKEGKKYQYLRLLKFTNEKLFRSIIMKISHELPDNIILFPMMSLTEATAQLTIHSAIRMLQVRNRVFKKLKNDALEHRSAYTIRSFIRTKRITRHITHITDMLHYMDDIPESMTFFVTQPFLDYVKQDLESKNPTELNSFAIDRSFTQNDQEIKNGFPHKYEAEFGFTTEKNVVLPTTNPNSFLANFIPSEKIVYRGLSLSMLATVQTLIRPGIPSMFSMPITPKILQIGKIRRITFSSPEEAFRRIYIFAFITNDFRRFMTDEQALHYSAALMIQNHWKSYMLRKDYRHLSANFGKRAKPEILLKQVPKVQQQKKYEEIHPTFQKLVRNELSPDEVIANLRGDYRPHDSIHMHRSIKTAESLYNDKPYKSTLIPQEKKNEEEVELKTDAMRNVGLVNDLEDEYRNLDKSIHDNPPKITKNIESQPTPLLTKINNKRPLTENARKLPKFEIELETNNVFAPGMTKINRESYNYDPLQAEEATLFALTNRPQEAITPIDTSDKAYDSIREFYTIQKRVIKKDDRFKSPPPLKNRKKPEKKEKEKEKEIPNQQDDDFDDNIDNYYDEMAVNQTMIPFRPTPKVPLFNGQTIHSIPEDDSEMLDVPFKSDRGTMSSSNESPVPTHQQTPSTTPTPTVDSSRPINKADDAKKPEQSPVVNKTEKSPVVKPKQSNAALKPKVNFANPKPQSALNKTSTVKANIDNKRSQTSMSNKPPKRLLDINEQPRKKNDSPQIHVPTPKLQATHYKPTQMKNGEFTESLTYKNSRPLTATNFLSFLPSDLTTTKEVTEFLKNTSPQWTDSTLKNALQRAFTKLVRLHQLGIQIEQAMITDTTFADNKKTTFDIRTQTIQARENLKLNKEEEIRDLIERNKIEQSEREELVKELRAKTALVRMRSANKVRSKHNEAINKYKKNRDFAINFVSVSRKLSQQVESKHLKAGKRKKLEDQANKVYKLRQETLEMKDNYKQKVKDMEEEKLKVAKRDKLLNENKRDIQTRFTERRMARLQAIKEDEKLMKEAFKEFKTTKKFVTSNVHVPVETDDVNAAAILVDTYMDAAMGEIESHLLCEIIGDIISP